MLFRIMSFSETQLWLILMGLCCSGLCHSGKHSYGYYWWDYVVQDYVIRYTVGVSSFLTCQGASEILLTFWPPRILFLFSPGYWGLLVVTFSSSPYSKHALKMKWKQMKKSPILFTLCFPPTICLRSLRSTYNKFYLILKSLGWVHAKWNSETIYK